MTFRLVSQTQEAKDTTEYVVLGDLFSNEKQLFDKAELLAAFIADRSAQGWFRVLEEHDGVSKNLNFVGFGLHSPFLGRAGASAGACEGRNSLILMKNLLNPSSLSCWPNIHAAQVRARIHRSHEMERLILVCDNNSVFIR